MKMQIETIKLRGDIHYVLRNEETGEIVEEGDRKNLVVDVGLAHITSRMTGTVQAVMSHIGLGTGTTAAVVGDTTLETALGARQATTPTVVTTNSANDSVQHVATFGAGVATGAITEAGLFNDLSAGTMLCRTVFAVINKGASDSLTVTWKVVLNQ
jgi:hypothetical protein